MFQIGIDKTVDLVAKQVERAGDGKRDQKWQDEKACIEMPAPDGAVKVGRRTCRNSGIRAADGEIGHGSLQMSENDGRRLAASLIFMTSCGE